MDEIALSMGMAGDSRRRVEASVLFELTYNLNNGHVFLPRDKLIAAASQLIDCPPDCPGTDGWSGPPCRTAPPAAWPPGPWGPSAARRSQR